MADSTPPLHRIDEADMARRLLATEGRCVIVSHLRPDGDAVGSSLALWHALRDAGRAVICLGVGPVAATYDYLEGLDEIVPAEGFEPAPGDVLVVLDCGEVSRLRESVRPLLEKMPVLCIDHHGSSHGFGGPICLEPDAGSVSEVLYRILAAAKLPISRACAEALWTGIITDTGRFSYDATSPDTMRAGAELLRAGVRSDYIAECVYTRNELRRLRLQRRLLDSIDVRAGGRVVLVSLSAADYAAEGCTGEDSENFVDIARSVRGCEIAAFVRQTKPGAACNLSLRTKPPFDAAALCATWDGGGHVRASGATLAMPLADAIAAVAARLEAAVAEA